MKNMFISHSTNISSLFKRFVLLFMVIFITASPITSLVFEIYGAHIEVYEICDEDDSKEKVVFSYDKEIKDQRIYQSQKQFSLSFDIFLTDFSPEVPFPPPKNI